MKLSAAVATAACVLSAHASSPVQKVIQLLDELKAKVQADVTVESKQMAEYTQFCDDEQSAKAYAIKTAGRQIDNFKAVIEDATGQIQDHEATIENLAGEMASKGQEADAAQNVRNNENADFKAAEKELVDAIDTLGRAVIIIKREMSFVQTGKNSKPNFAKQLAGISAALSHVIDAAWLDSGSRRALQTFVEESESADDELRLRQPQAIVHSYENHSKGIVETLEEMKDKAESALNKLRREEMNSKHAFQLLHQSLKDAIAVLQEDLTESQNRKASAQEVLGKAQSDLASTETTKAADEKYLQNLTTECQSKASEWVERQKSAKEELAALVKAHEILSGKFAFSQLSVKFQSFRDNGYEKRDRVVEVVKKLAREYHSFALMQLANAAQQDPFVKVRGLIESMIANLLEQAQQEADHNSFCKEELAKSSKARETKSSYVDKYSARVDAAKAGIQELKNQIAQLHAEILEIDRSNTEATKLRTEERAEYEKSSTDYKESADAIVQAVQVLKDFYKSDAFLQTSATQPTFAGAKSDSTHGIIEILETAESDFTRLLAETEAGESENQQAYDKLIQENKVSKAAKKQAIVGKTSEQKSLEVALMHHQDDLTTVNKELDAVMEYLAKLKPQCENKAMTYEERKARREAEVEGLKEALSILEGEDAAAFVQRAMRGQKFLGRSA